MIEVGAPPIIAATPLPPAPPVAHLPLVPPPPPVPPAPQYGHEAMLAGRAPLPPGAAVEDQFELHFIGELEAGSGFPHVSQSDALFVDYSAHAGQEWLLRADAIGQTQSAYADAEGTHAFNHPLDLHYVSASMEGWPRLHLQVLRLDQAGCVEAVAYGALALPMHPGHSELECRTWTPVGPSLLGEARVLHRVGGAPALHAAACVAVLEGSIPEARAQMVTKSSGTVRISLDTVFRNAGAHGILPSAFRGPRSGASSGVAAAPRS